MRQPMIPTNQEQLVKEKLGHESKVRHDITEKLSIPGIENLHLKPVEEIALVLANVIKSRRAIKSFTYQVGEYIEISSESEVKI